MQHLSESLQNRNWFFYELWYILYANDKLRVFQKVRSLTRGGGGVTEKRTKTNRRRGVLVCVYIRFFKKMLDFQNELL